MKILMLGWELPPHNSGGLGVACYQLCQALSNSGSDIDFILPYDAEHNIDFMKITPALPGGVDKIETLQGAYQSYLYTYTDGSTENVGLFDQYERYAAGVEKILKLGEYDVIHAHDWLTFRGAIRAKMATGKPLFVHIHATEYDRSGGKRGHPMVEEIEYAGMMLADRIIAVSQATKNTIVNHYGISPDKIDVVHNNIDPDYYEKHAGPNAYSYLEQLKSQGWQIVTNIGRLTVQKGLYNFLLAAREVVARAPKTIFLVVGSGEQLYELIEHAAGLGIGKNVMFVDFQRGKNLADAFKVSDLFVMPSISEPFGLTPLEAVYYGTPVLVSKQSGVAEVLSNCLKVDYWDVNEMANQITSVVLHGGLRESLREGSAAELRQMSWNNSARKLQEIYGRVMEAVA